MKPSLFKLIATSMLIVSSQANAFEFTKPIHEQIPATKTIRGVVAPQSEVTIMGVKLSDHERDVIANRDLSSHALEVKLPSRVNLGMNHVPVLNQGRHGSCVTFAVSAAIDAVLGKGDHVSQLCSLELGSYLEKYSYLYSGWNGSYGPLILNQMMDYGVVSKDVQYDQGCSGIKRYPVADAGNTGHAMSLKSYSMHHENLNKKLYWKHLYSNDQIFDWPTAKPEKMGKVLVASKEALMKGHRLTIGTFLILTPRCHSGACATHNAAGDTWALSKELETPPYEVGGHEMVIYAYDDNAVAVDGDGVIHKGLFTLRNSWGGDRGYKGDYYMTYDYFMKYVNEVQEIVDIRK